MSRANDEDVELLFAQVDCVAGYGNTFESCDQRVVSLKE